MAKGAIVADYRIVCATKENGHIVAVGTGTEPTKYTKKWTVAQVRAAMKAGDKFHTVGGDKKAYVEPFDGIRTQPDHVKINNLDNLSGCG